MNKWYKVWAITITLLALPLMGLAQEIVISPQDIFASLRTAVEQGVEFDAPVPNRDLVNTVEDFTIVQTEVVNGLEIMWTNHALLDRGDGSTFQEFARESYNWPELVASQWPTAPNVPNTLVTWFRTVDGTQVPDGVEIPDSGERNFCQVLEGEWCTNVVAARHYMLYTGNGYVPGLWNGINADGNAFSYWNVGETDARLDGVFLQGWRLTGRYFNGDTLPYGLVATHAHAAANMLGLPSVLNPAGFTNAGSNCANPNACSAIRHTAVIASGNAPMLIVVATSR